jgi:hypothetical protein
MKTREIHTSRLKLMLLLGISLGFVAFALLIIKHTNRSAVGLPNLVDLQKNADSEFLAALFFLGSVGVALQLFWPLHLLLDEEGFTLKGGFIRSPKRVLWRDVDHFFVFEYSIPAPLPVSVKRIAYNYKPGLRKPHLVGDPFDGKLPNLWPKGPEDMVDELNAYRLGDGRWE